MWKFKAENAWDIVWKSIAGQAVANSGQPAKEALCRGQNFEMGEENEVLVSVKEGDIFHYNNSFKYPPGFFEDCAEDAGLEIIEFWEGQGSVRLYLFHVPAIETRNSFNAPKLSWEPQKDRDLLRQMLLKRSPVSSIASICSRRNCPRSFRRRRQHAHRLRKDGPPPRARQGR